MAIFQYRCEKCGEFEQFHPVGKAPNRTKCDRCGDEAKRILTPISFSFGAGGAPSANLRFNREMTKRNEAAGQRMKARDPIKLVNQS